MSFCLLDRLIHSDQSQQPSQLPQTNRSLILQYITKYCSVTFDLLLILWTNIWMKDVFLENKDVDVLVFVLFVLWIFSLTLLFYSLHNLFIVTANALVDVSLGALWMLHCLNLINKILSVFHAVKRYDHKLVSFIIILVSYFICHFVTFCPRFTIKSTLTLMYVTDLFVHSSSVHVIVKK